MNARSLALVVATAVLAACGKGKSEEQPPTGPAVRYGGVTTDATLTPATAYSVAGSAAAIAQGAGGAATSGVAGLPGGFVVGHAGEAQPPATLRGALLRAEQAFRHPGLATVAGAWAAASGSCPHGGTFSIQAHQQTAHKTTPGDFVQVALSGCKDDLNDVAWGSFRFTVEENATLDEFVSDVKSITTNENLRVSLLFHDFASVKADGSWSGVDGDLGLRFVASVDPTGAGTLEFHVQGTSFVAASGPAVGTVAEATWLQSFTELGREVYGAGMGKGGTPAPAKTEGAWSVNGRVCSLDLHGCLRFLTAPEFAKREAAAYPYAGVIQISRPLTSDFVRLSVVDPNAETNGKVTVDWDIAGVTSTVDTTWACVNGTGPCP